MPTVTICIPTRPAGLGTDDLAQFARTIQRAIADIAIYRDKRVWDTSAWREQPAVHADGCTRITFRQLAADDAECPVCWARGNESCIERGVLVDDHAERP